MNDRRRPSEPRLTPLVPPRPKPPANSELVRHELNRHGNRVDELARVHSEASLEREARDAALMVYLRKREENDAAQNEGIRVLARALGQEAKLPGVLCSSMPPPALESVASTSEKKPEEPPIVPKIGADASRARRYGVLIFALVVAHDAIEVIRELAKLLHH